MYKSYYFLNRVAIELNNRLSGKIIKSIFSQEKDKLIIQCTNMFDGAVEISVNHAEPYITYRDKFARAKKNTVDIFTDLHDHKISSVSIADDDRVIKFQTTNGELYFTIRGKFTNIYFKNKSTINSFKDEDESSLNEIISEFSKKNYLQEFNLISNDAIEGLSIESIRAKLKFIGRELEFEVKSIWDQEKDHSSGLLQLLNNIKSSDIVIYSDLANNKITIGFDNLKIFNNYHKEYIGDLFKTFNEYLYRVISLNKNVRKSKIISNVLEKELKKTLNRMDKLEKIIETGPRDILLRKYADLILININKIESGASQLICEDDFNPGNFITISLDKRISPQKNAEKYFESAKNNLIEFEKAKEIFLQSKLTLKKLQNISKELEGNLTKERIDQIMRELKIKDENQSNKNEDYSEKFKHYLIAGKYHVYVGKDSQNNDLLTTKFAKQNDIWFHARSVSGSHVVLRIVNTKEVIPKPVIKKAASLAAYHSKAKTAGIVPVSYTFKKYVVKRKGMPAGQVSLLKEDVLLVKPEIPDECDYIQS